MLHALLPVWAVVLVGGAAQVVVVIRTFDRGEAGPLAVLRLPLFVGFWQFLLGALATALATASGREQLFGGVLLVVGALISYSKPHDEDHPERVRAVTHTGRAWVYRIMTVEAVGLLAIGIALGGLPGV